MEAFIEFEIYGVLIRYYNEKRIERVMNERWGKSKWKTIKQTNTRDGYKSICIHDNKNVRVHRIVYKANNLEWDITDVSKNNFIDHLDQVRSNNKIENLQVATAQQNNFNTNAKGYSFDIRRNKYQAQICRDGKRIYLGYYDTEDQAHSAYLKAKLIYHV